MSKKRNIKQVIFKKSRCDLKGKGYTGLNMVFGLMLAGCLTLAAPPDTLGVAGGSGDGTLLEITYVENRSDEAGQPSSWGAMLRSMVMPGWGHYYVDPDDWRRGQYHLAADVALLASYLGISRQAYVLNKNMYTHANAYSGVDIRAHGRDFELAVGNFLSWHDYIDYHERARNWDRVFRYPDSPEYRWEWESEAMRRDYRQLRSRRDHLNQQLPALATFMVLNRVISGISAFSRARTRSNSLQALYLTRGPALDGFEVRLSVTF